MPAAASGCKSREVVRKQIEQISKDLLSSRVDDFETLTSLQSLTSFDNT
jgi:hypothetical protein